MEISVRDDGEKALYQPFEEELDGDHSLCSIPVKRSTARYLDKCSGVNSQKKTVILNGLFGMRLDDDSYKPGLVNAESAKEFHHALPKLES